MEVLQTFQPVKSEIKTTYQKSFFMRKPKFSMREVLPS